MTCRLARRLLATTLSAALVLLSPGLEAPRLFAQVIGRAAPVEGVRALPGLPMAAPGAALTNMTAPALMAPTISAPSAFLAAPIAAPAAAPKAATPAAALSATARAIAPQLEAVGKTETGADVSREAGQTIIDVLTGAKSAGTGAAADISGREGSGAPALSARLAASAPSEAPKQAVPAAATPAATKTVDSAVSYGLRRFLLKTVAALTGAVYSLPSAGPAITAKLVASAADKRVVLSDYDDTLASYNQVLPQEMVEAVQAVKAAGKDFVVISDRGDEPRPHQLSVFESLASLPAETRAGMYVAANSGGRVYRYDEKGEPVRVFEVPALDELSKAKVAMAAESTKARLVEIGAEQHKADGKNPAESWGTYGYALMLKVGSSEAQVRGAAAILEEELSKSGIKVEVNPRFAKDPANPPYINFSIVTKEASAGYIAKALNAEAKDVLVIGDSMYAPHEAKKASWLTRLARRASGRELPQTGNATDRNMEKGVPGALTLGVGTTGDPRTANLFVLDGKGPSVTRRVLMSVASKTRGAAKSGRLSENVVAGLTVAAIVAAAAAGYYAMFSAFADIAVQAEQMLRGASHDLLEGGMMLGGVLGMLRGAKPGDDKASRYAALEAEYAAMLAKTPGVVGVKIRDSYHPLAGNINNIVGKWIEVVFDGVPALQSALAAGLLPKTLPAIDGLSDVKIYEVTPVVAPKARKAAYAALEAEYVAKLSQTPGVVDVKVSDSYHYLGGEMNDVFGKGIEIVFDGVPSLQKALASGLLPKTLPAIDGVRDVKEYNVSAVVAPKARKAAYAALEAGHVAQLAELPGVVDVKVKDSYHYYGGKMNDVLGKWIEVSFDGVTSLQKAEADGLLPKTLPAIDGVRDVKNYVVTPVVAAPESKLKAFLLWLAGAAAVVAIYGAFFYAATHGVPAPSGVELPAGWQGPIPIDFDIGRMFGGFLGLAGVVGLAKGRHQPLVPGVSYAEGVSSEHQALFAETLTRRKAGWTRELARMGLTLDGPGSPAVSVRSAAANKAGDRVVFTVDWKLSETKLGSFKAVVALKTLQPALSRLPDPAASEAAQLTVRFRKTVSAEQIAEFLEQRGLRVLSKGWEGIYKVAVTGAAQADLVARELSGQGLVVYATPTMVSIPEERRLRVFFKKTTGVDEGDIGVLLRELGLRVLSVERDGAWTVGPDEGTTAASAAAKLETASVVLYAAPLKFDAPWQRQLVLTFGETSEDDLARVLRTHGLTVVKDLGGALKVAVREGASAVETAKALAGETVVKSALALGGVTDAQVLSAAQGAASYKGRPWSSTEYNMAWYQSYNGLELRGATPEQLQLFEKTTAEAPVRGGGFNPWSGD